MEPKFRVLRIGDGLRERVKESRARLGLPLAKWLVRAVGQELEAIRLGLEAAGFEQESDDVRPIRLPLAEGDLVELRRVADASGIPATTIMRAILLRACQRPAQQSASVPAARRPKAKRRPSQCGRKGGKS